MILSRPDLQELVNSNPDFIKRTNNHVVVDIASITLHLHDTFSWYTEHPASPFVPPKDLRTDSRTLNNGEFFNLLPQEKVLACSDERVQMSLEHMGFIQTKGSIARAFLITNMCDGQIDPGYSGRITFELINLGDFNLQLFPGMPIAQLFIAKLSKPVAKADAYAGRYAGAERPTPMKEMKGHHEE